MHQHVSKSHQTAVTVNNGVVTPHGGPSAATYSSTRPNPMPSGLQALSRSQTIFRSVCPMSTKGRIQIAREAVARIEGEISYPWDKIRLIVKDGWLTLEGAWG